MTDTRAAFEAAVSRLFTTGEHSLSRAYPEGYYNAVSSNTYGGRRQAEYSAVSMLWDVWQAAVLHERSECAKVCEKLEDDYRAAYKGRTEPIDRAALYNPHTDGESDGAGECAAAIRARD